MTGMTPYDGLKNALTGIRNLVCAYLDGEMNLNLETARDAFHQIEMLSSVALATNKPRNCDISMKNLHEYQKRYIDHGCKKGLGMVVDGEIKKAPWKSNFEEWLFSEAE